MDRREELRRLAKETKTDAEQHFPHTAPRGKTEESPMITGVSVVTVVVRDQEAAFRFFTEKLGFRKQTDVHMGPEGNRWLSVIPQTGTGPELTLFDPRSWMGSEAAEEMLQLIGKMPGLVLQTDDCRKTVAELAAKGVTILREPTDEPYGVEAVFADLFGNTFVLVQPPQQ